jgi:hypothetical protein
MLIFELNKPRVYLSRNLSRDLIYFFLQKVIHNTMVSFQKQIKPPGNRSGPHRLLFAQLCPYFLRHYSRRWFKENLIAAAIDLLHDPVANVRLAVVPLLPRLKRGLRMPVRESLPPSLSPFFLPSIPPPLPHSFSLSLFLSFSPFFISRS